jgi:hypothetical protein
LPLTILTAKYIKGRVRVVRTVRMLRDTPYSKVLFLHIKEIYLDAKDVKGHSLQSGTFLKC